jgi:leucyl aminopeptidase
MPEGERFLPNDSPLAYLVPEAKVAVPLTPVSPSELSTRFDSLGAQAKSWIESTGFKAEPGSFALLPDSNGKLARVLAGASKEGSPGNNGLWDLAGLPSALPEGIYALDGVNDREKATRMALGWALGCYAFARYKKPKRDFAKLVWPQNADRGKVERLAKGHALARDLINTPAEEMGPAELQTAAEELARNHQAACRTIIGDDLLKQNYPTIHAVGRASSRAPRLIDIVWGNPSAPKVTLVGKGVCFDTGGLDLKTAAGMRLMKKDMGGAATVLGLAGAIMDAGLPVRLRVLIPAVDNAVAGNAMRPMDVIRTRKGISVEVGDTDAEGRLILCDALAEAAAENPALIIDLATLTGAARVALGPELPALFASDEELAADIVEAGKRESDPLWRLPLWRPYREMLKSNIADINNVSDSSFAGAITAALYLAEFVPHDTKWAHIDTYAWNQKTRPGRPEGGEALCLRALYAMIEARFGGKR